MGTILPILMYHAVHPQESVISLHPDIFAWQMRWLRDKEFNVIPLEQCANLIGRGETFPERAIVITFDDGYQGLYDYALPVLVENNFPATIFLVTDYCGRSNAWPGQPPGIPKLPLLEWSQIQEMHKNGITFGAHTMSHPRLDALNAGEIEEEIIGSKRVIEQRLGTEVFSFAYPYGRYDPGIKEVVGQNFRVACSTMMNYATNNSDYLLLPRVEMYYLKYPSMFKQLSNKKSQTYIYLRGKIRYIISGLRNRQWQ
jgi:peptidoglycan/xylan/chitin deacetylase (PgdA/CDA1 family)